MGKKILVISGSPRRGGNSDLLCDALIRGAVDSGHTAEKSLPAGSENRRLPRLLWLSWHRCMRAK